MNERQVFSTMSPRRWRIVKTTGGVLLLIMLIILGIFCTTLYHHNIPNLPKYYTQCSQPLEKIAQDTSLSWHQQAANSCCMAHQPLLLTPLSNDAPVLRHQQIRAAFLVQWDLQSLYSLKNNITKINTVLPDWLSLDTNCKLNCKIDTAAYSFLQQNKKVSVLPVLANFGKEHTTDTLLTDPQKQIIFINSLVDTIKKYGFNGINLDFEEFEVADMPQFYTFIENLHHRFQAEKLVLGQVIVPYNANVDAKKLYENSDLLFVEAFNEYYETGVLRAIAGLDWVEKWMTKLSDTLSRDKFVLCAPTFGLDWGKKGVEAGGLTYRMAISIAEEAQAKVKFNPTTYNLEFEYSDADKVAHKVIFTDAATTFNQIRAVNYFQWRGVALHRLGAEDPRTWDFFDKDLSDAGLQRGSFDIKNLSKVIIPQDVDYVGNDRGEVMDVIDDNPTEGSIRFDYDFSKNLIKEEFYDKLPASYVVQKFGKDIDNKLVLTFDDGPDKEYTTKILDILKREHVPAAFFLIGKNIEANPNIVKRIYDEGHEIGNHTYFHPEIHRVMKPRAEAELILTRRSIESLIGRSTILFRPPYNPYVEPQNIEQLNAFLLARRQNYLTVSESIDPLDWQKGITADEIFNRIREKVEDSKYGHVILMHDAGGDRSETIKALPRVIRYFKDKGFQFVSIGDLIGKSRAETMPELNQEQKPLIALYRAVSDFTGGMNNTLVGVFAIAMFFGTFRLLFVLYFALKQYFKEKNTVWETHTPPLSIIVPAYNEEVGAVSTVASLLNQNYPEYQVVFVDDGSKDKTYEVVKKAYEGHPRVQVLTKPNGGKASALNYGLKRCKNDIVVCIDADTILDPNALHHLAKPFADPKVGAVAGNVIVGNQVNMLTKWQSIEYVTAQNFDRMAFAYLNCITVVPGAIGAFRRQAIGSVGWYETDTLAEDCDLTVRIIRKGYRVTHNNDAIAITESPETYPQFLKQRLRWCFGVMQAFWKNKHVLFNRQYGTLGWVAFPNILFFGLIFPILSPIADFALVMNILTTVVKEAAQLVNQAGYQQPGFYEKYSMIFIYLAYTLIDVFVSAVAFYIQKEPLTKLWMLFPQRFVYRPLSYYILFKSYLKALKGELMGWGVLKRTGSIGQVTVKQEAPIITQQDIELKKSPSVG